MLLIALSTPTTAHALVADGSVAAPEPATLFLLGGGLVGLAWFGRKKFKK